MQGLHHHPHQLQQHQLVALLSVALPKDDSSAPPSSSSPAAPSPSPSPPPAAGAAKPVPSAESDESTRLGAIGSLHRAILYPPNSLLVAHSAAFLSQGLLQLLSDKSYSVRQLAATAYGALCAVVCSIPITSNGRQNHVMLGTMVDRFISWSLPLLNNVNAGDGTAELALDSLREFLNVGDVNGIERYALPILKACQQLLEDERTSLSLLHRLLGVITLISLKFSRCFQPHFVDIVDLLLGWALIPDFGESDRRVIMDCFLQCQKHWVSNLQFSLGLMSKFLGDMDALLQDGSLGTPQQFRRLLALLSCFSTILQSTASGLLEANLLGQIREPLSKMLPQLLGCLSLLGQRFGWSKWIGDLWKCLTLLAEILRENFSTLYPLAVDTLFQSMKMNNGHSAMGAGKISSFQVHGVLKTNLQLLSLQKLGLLSSSVHKILQFDAPVSQLRLHPNHVVTASCAATYVFLLQHGNNEVVQQAMDSLLVELDMLKGMLKKALVHGDVDVIGPHQEIYSKLELFALIKFDLKVLLTCVLLSGNESLIDRPDVATLYLQRSETLACFLLEHLNPLNFPIEACVDLQISVMMTLERLSTVEFLSKCATGDSCTRNPLVDVASEDFLTDASLKNRLSAITVEHLRKFCCLLIKALHVSSPLAVKLTALEWVRRFCENVLAMTENLNSRTYLFDSFICTGDLRNLIFSVLDAASDKEPKVRSHVALVLELLWKARLLHPINFCLIAQAVLERLGDPEHDMKTTFTKLLCHVLPAMVYSCGLYEYGTGVICKPLKGNISSLHWKQLFALKQLPRQLQAQQLVSILSYISQRWKVPLSCWVQRLIHSCRRVREPSPNQLEEIGSLGTCGAWLDIEVDDNVLEEICSVNVLAGAWWAIHEAARYCVSTRLRTNLGGPSQTFAALERMLLDVVHVLQLDSEQNDGNLILCLAIARVKRSLVSSALKETSRSQISETFQTIRSRFSEDILRVLHHMALALCRCHEPEALVGLQTWVSMTFPSLLVEENQFMDQNGALRPLAWITGLVYQAEGQYEKSAAHFTHLLQNEESLSLMGSAGVQFAIARIIESYSALSDWRSLESWLVELQMLRARHAGKSYAGALTTAGNEINAIHALAHFDEGEHQAAWASLDLTPKSSSELSLDPKVALLRSEQMLLQAMLLQVEGKIEKLPHDLQKSKQMLEEALAVLPLDGLTDAAAYATQLHCILEFERGFTLRGASKVSDADESILKAKACLKLSNWLQCKYSDISLEMLSAGMQADFEIADFSLIGKGGVPLNYDNLSSQRDASLIIEEIISTATKLSTRLCPFMGKSWISYGSWCFNQARNFLLKSNETALHSCSSSPFLVPEVQPDRLKLNDDEMMRVESMILQRVGKLGDAVGLKDRVGEKDVRLLSGENLSNVNLVKALLQQVVNIIEVTAGAPGAEDSASDCLSSSVVSSSYTLRATLYVLHILLNYGVELKETLEPSLSAVPLFPWQEVTPQLFARLSSHPEQVVRRQLQSLLMMLGKRSPWSIVYPTLVDVNANEDKPSEELQHVLGCLLDLHPKLIQDVQLMINELSNVTVLWEELWLSTLHDLHSDVMRRIHILKEEAARIAENITLSQSEKSKINAAKYSAMMAPVILTLERRLASTTRKPVTPHETRFHEQYIEQLKSAILTFKNPPKSAASLADVWRPFDTIAASLTSYQRKSSVSLGEVAPQLALLSSSDVPMPGLEKLVALSEADGGLTVLPSVVTISSFSEQVTIISTKTKPKKINIVGSDGQNYPYLLKGREDLRLDARIMQLLHAIDSLLHSSRTTRSHLVGVRHYSVTPISGRAGLIQWVDNVISVYSVYKCWQARDQAAVQPSSGTGNTKTVPPPVPRPSDMFYGKIIPALKEKGIRRVISRKDWPHEVKRKVLMDLMQEVPRQLLYQELWCASEGFKAFNLKLKRYTGSVAAMSMVGHILGLGDRHLDNILVDFRSGDILHIDYNICFDKGLRLKIPEIVPFRLTQMIEAALGLTGVEGIFKANCEAVLGVLRKNKDILLMLLEVFVWDPLVEWTRGDFHDDAAIGGEERKGMELAVSLSLFASRVQEIRVPLQEHHDLLISSLPAVESALERFSDVLNNYELISALFCRADQEQSNLILHETSAKSIVAEATCNSEKLRASFEIQAREFSQAKALVAEKAQETTSWIEQHGRILDALRGNLIADLNAWNNLSSLREALSLSSAVLVAGVPLTVVPEPTQVQCTDLDRELSKLVAELDHGVSSSLTAIQVYSLALQRILPLNYLTTSTVYSWAQILQLCSGVLTSDIISIARRQAAELISKILNDSRDSVKHAHDDLCLKVSKYAFEIGKVEDECAELENSVGSEAESKAKDRLLSSFMKYMQSATVEKKDNLHSPVYPGQSEYDDTNNVRILDMADANGKGDGNSDTSMESREPFPEENWASIFKSTVVSCKSLVDQLSDVLPDVIRNVVAFNSEFADVFGSVSQVRGTIDSALEQLLEVEMERGTVIELERNYFVKVALITERQLALEEAALKGRDHLSWEEAEELASQEESCRAQLDQLHQSWNQRDKRTSSLIKRETDVESVLSSCQRHFQSLMNAGEEIDSLALRGQALLSTLVNPFHELESLDKVLSSVGASSLHAGIRDPNLADCLSSGQALSEKAWLEKMKDHSKQLNGSRKELVFEQSHKDLGAVKRVQLMLEEYCNAHETARAARSAASLMKRQVHELKENVKKDCIEIVQMEWMHDVLLTPSPNSRITLHKLLASGDNLQQIILNLNRQRLLEVMQSAVSRIALTIEGLQAVERTSLAAEGQLERAMGWACGGSSSGLAGNSSSKMSKIPPEFHDYLTSRRQLLWDAREKASEIIKICMSILEFEASRDGIFWVPGGEHPLRMSNDCRAWQQANLSSLTRLDVAYHSFTRIEQEWKLAQSSMEAASNGLFSATNELCIASLKAKSASDELQKTILAMRDCAYEASIALSAYGRVSRGHTALTSECGSMLEEVLTITEDLHDVNSLGKEAASMHHSLVEGLIKANAILLPLESILSKDVTAMTDAIAMERESKIEISPIHGQAIYQSYRTRVGEACHALKPLLPALTSSVKGLLSLLTKLAQTASLHAGNLHKALEGAGESQEENLPRTDLSRPNFSGNASSFDDREEELAAPDEEIMQDFVSLAGLSLQDKGWVSPPDSICTSSLGSCVSSPEASIADSLKDPAEEINSSCRDDGATCADTSSQSDPRQIAKITHEGAKCSQSIPVMPLTGGTTEQPNDGASTRDQDIAFPVYTSDTLNKETELEYRGKNKMPSSRNIIDDGCSDAPNPNGHAGGRVARGKNAYALSVLRRIEMKLDGRDIDETREVSTAEQVDYLIKQASSMDNLCNMYEGWTPWI
ncbi:hypothetical protein NL676_015583 [Syzygium grande]|nr:hypothetical protein NL676_015583 [Syzygium grande]